MAKLSSNAEQIVSSRFYQENEDWEKLSIRCGTEAARPESQSQKSIADNFSEIIYNLEFLPAGRILRNLGRLKGSLFNCYVLPLNDSIEEIGQYLKETLIVWSEGGGIGTNISNLRPEKAPIKGKGGFSSGPISFLQADNEIAKTIETGGQRRAAGLGMMLANHPDIIKFIDAKRAHNILNYFNISVGVDESFLECVESNKDWNLLFNQKVYDTVKAKDIWNKIMESMVKHAEPGLINWSNLRSNNSYYFAPIFATNPCFSSDSKILTKQGHFEIKDLVGKVVDVWDGEQWVEIDNFRVTGENQTMTKITFYDGSELRVTPYHKFVLEDGTGLQTKDLKIGDKLKPSNGPLILHGNVQEQGAYLKGFMLGDGIKRKKFNHPGLKLYEPKYCCKDRLIESALEISIENINTNSIKEVKFQKDGGNDRLTLTGLTVRKNDIYKRGSEYRNKLPKEVFQWDLRSKCDFIAGLFDADGSVTNSEKDFGYQLWACSKKMLQDIQLLLKTIGVYSKIIIGKVAGKKNFNDGYGEYDAQDCYRLFISQKFSIKLSKMVKFERLVSFEDKTVKYNTKNKFNEIVSIEENGIDEKVYCCTVPKSHKVSLSSGILTGQCGEVALEEYGICNLGSIVLPNFVTNVNTNWRRMREVLSLAVRFLDNIIDINKYILPEFDISAHNGRRIGIGTMGLADYLFAKKVRYGSQKAIQETEKVFKFIRDVVYEESIKLSIEKGAFPKFDPIEYGKAHFIRSLPAPMRIDIKKYGIRNVTLLAAAPTGTISLIPEVSSGIEPLSVKAYKRSDRVSERYYVHPLLKKNIEDNKSNSELPDWFVDSFDLEPKDHLNTQAAVQKYIDGAVSKTLLMPKGTTSKDLSDLLLEYIHDLKGVTVYVDGSREGQPIQKMDIKEAVKSILDGDHETNINGDMVKCSSGKCDL